MDTNGYESYYFVACAGGQPLDTNYGRSWTFAGKRRGAGATADYLHADWDEFRRKGLARLLLDAALDHKWTRMDTNYLLLMVMSNRAQHEWMDTHKIR